MSVWAVFPACDMVRTLILAYGSWRLVIGPGYFLRHGFIIKGGRISCSSSVRCVIRGGPDRVEPETSRLIEIGTLLTGIIHVFSLSIGYQFILFPLVSGASYYLCPFIVCRRNVPQ